MKYTFSYIPPSQTTLSSIKNHKVFEKKIIEYLKKARVKNTSDYNKTLRAINTLAKTLGIPTTVSKFFKGELSSIQKKKPLTEVTPWGGVTLKKVDVEKDFIQKLLLVKKYGVLGFEIHKKKHEQLQILEGYCLVFWINHRKKATTTICVQLGGPKDTYTFSPKDEHGILSLTNCVIEETSTNHLDDLVYVFKAHL